MDHFAEYLVQKRPTSQDRLKQGLIVAAAVVLSVLIGAISVLTGWLFLLVLVIGAIYGAYYLLTGCYTEYEYTVTNGELDVDKIVGKRKRSHLLTVPVSKFTGFGVYTRPMTPRMQLYFSVRTTREKMHIMRISPQRNTERLG